MIVKNTASEESLRLHPYKSRKKEFPSLSGIAFDTQAQLPGMTRSAFLGPCLHLRVDASTESVIEQPPSQEAYTRQNVAYKVRTRGEDNNKQEICLRNVAIEVSIVFSIVLCTIKLITVAVGDSASVEAADVAIIFRQGNCKWHCVQQGQCWLLVKVASA